MSLAVRRAAFAKRLDAVRREQHFSIRAAARMVSVPTATMQGWLSGQHFPTPALRHRYLHLVESLGLQGELPSDIWADSLDSRVVQPPHPSASPPGFMGIDTKREGTQPPIQNDGSPHSVIVSADRKLLAIGHSDNRLWLWDISNPQVPRRSGAVGGIRAQPTAVAWEQNVACVAIGDEDGRVAVWDLSHCESSESPVALHGLTSPVTALAFCSGGTQLAAASDGDVWVWDLPERQRGTITGYSRKSLHPHSVTSSDARQYLLSTVGSG